MNIYPENFEHKIDFGAIRAYLKEKCLSPLGIDKVDAMQFSTDYQTIECLVSQTDQFTQIISNKKSFPTAHFNDIRDALKQVSTDHSLWLTEKEIPQLSNSLETIVRIVAFLNDESGNQL